MNIIELAKQAEFSDREIQISHDNFARFAALVAAHERERIEKAWDKLYGWWESDDETKTRGTT